MTPRKYELTDEMKNFGGVLLHRIKALRTFSDIAEGDLGGWIESEKNLEHAGDAWVSGAARVYGDAWVSGAARVSGDAWVSGAARVSGDAWVSGAARVSKQKDILVIGPLGSGRFITATHSDGMIACGCFRGTLPEFIDLVAKKYPQGTDYNWFFGALKNYFEEVHAQ